MIHFTMLGCITSFLERFRQDSLHYILPFLATGKKWDKHAAKVEWGKLGESSKVKGEFSWRWLTAAFWWSFFATWLLQYCLLARLYVLSKERQCRYQKEAAFPKYLLHWGGCLKYLFCSSISVADKNPDIHVNLGARIKRCFVNTIRWWTEKVADSIYKTQAAWVIAKNLVSTPSRLHIIYQQGSDFTTVWSGALHYV